MLSRRERAVRAILHEEPDRIPRFESLSVAPPSADALLGRYTVLNDPVRQMEFRARGELGKYYDMLLQDTYDLTVKAGFDIGQMVVPPTQVYEPPEKRPRRIGPDTYLVDGVAVRAIPESGWVKEVEPQVPPGLEGLAVFEEWVRNQEGLSDDELTPSVESMDLYMQRLGLRYRELDVLVTSSTGFSIFGKPLPERLLALKRRPDLVRRGLRQAARQGRLWADLAIDYGAELFYTHGDIAYNHGPWLSPADYHEFMLPVMKEHVDHLHRKGVFVFNTSDGNLWPIIEDYLVNSGVDGMAEIQPTAGMANAPLKERFGDRICFNGGVDCAYTLTFGTPEEVAAETRKAIQILAPGGGVILSSSHDIHRGVPPQNFFAMLHAINKYGGYSARD